MNSNIYGKGIICNRDTREEARNKNWINYGIIIVLVLFLILLIFSV
jgi:t-SNARE complex subunit (syntaxin)